MKRIGWMVALGALTLAFGCDSRPSGMPDSGGIVLMDGGPPRVDTGPPGVDSGPPRVDSGPNCTTAGSFQACAECLCNQNNAGCNAYLTALVGNLFCGATCSTDCSNICADPSATPTAACNTCVEGLGDTSADVTNFRNACMADSSCVSFANSLGTCPG